MSRHAIEHLLEIMARLRHPEQGCPWDREQTFATIAPYTLEEAYEVSDAIARDEMGELRDELGDLLFQVVFHAQLAAEQGEFGFNDVLDAIIDKMIRRHPHVFADEKVEDSAEQSRLWEAQKAQERAERGQAKSHMDGVALALPALLRAEKLQRRALRAGLDSGSVERLADEVSQQLSELKDAIVAGRQSAIERELGDLLFTCTGLARKLDLEAESLLRGANERFEQRFRRLELEGEQQDGDLAERWQALLLSEKHSG